MSIVYLNGAFLPEEQAFVSVFDRGFMLGDGVYEVIPVYGGRLFRLAEHLQRLDHSFAGIRLANPLSHAAWQALLTELVERNGGGNQSVYLQVTRGVAKREFAFPKNVRPTVFAMATPIPEVPTEHAEAGFEAITVEDIRWRYCNIKAITLLPNVLMHQQAIDQGTLEAILIRDGEVTEGAASNVFIVHDGEIATPPKGPYLLPGVTRDLVLELADRNGLPWREQVISEASLHRAQEIWLTSSTREVVPVTRLNGEPVGDGRPGPVWRRVSALYRAYKEALSRGVGR